jgi:hypothetical protein
MGGADETGNKNNNDKHYHGYACTYLADLPEGTAASSQLPVILTHPENKRETEDHYYYPQQI